MDMDVDKAKLFVGGISRETTEEALRAHFSKYGGVLGSLVAKDKNTGSPRGFGFVWFSDPSFSDMALQDSHVILGRTVEVKKAIPKSEQHQYHQQQQHINQRKKSGFGKNSINGNNSDYFRTKKIFVGGLSANLTETQFRNYFERFGRIIDVVVMQDSSTNRPRGFGFVTFDSEESVDKVMLNTFHELNGRLVEVKRAVPKDEINSNSHVTRGGERGFSNQISQSGNHTPAGPGYEILRGYAPHPGYTSFGGYYYGTGFYGNGYPMIGYGRPSLGIPPIAPRNPWSGPMVIGAGSCLLPYSNACLYPAYMNGGVGMMSMMVGGFDGTIMPSANGNLNQVLGDNGGH